MHVERTSNGGRDPYANLNMYPTPRTSLHTLVRSLEPCMFVEKQQTSCEASDINAREEPLLLVIRAQTAPYAYAYGRASRLECEPLFSPLDCRVCFLGTFVSTHSSWSRTSTASIETRDGWRRVHDNGFVVSYKWANLGRGHREQEHSLSQHGR